MNGAWPVCVITGTVWVITEAVIRLFDTVACVVPMTLVGTEPARAGVVKGAGVVNTGICGFVARCPVAPSTPVVTSPLDITVLCVLAVWMTDGCAKRELIPTVTTGLLVPITPCEVGVKPSLTGGVLMMRGKMWGFLSGGWMTGICETGSCRLTGCLTTGCFPSNWLTVCRDMLPAMAPVDWETNTDASFLLVGEIWLATFCSTVDTLSAPICKYVVLGEWPMPLADGCLDGISSEGCLCLLASVACASFMALIRSMASLAEWLSPVLFGPGRPARPWWYVVEISGRE